MKKISSIAQKKTIPKLFKYVGGLSAILGALFLGGFAYSAATSTPSSELKAKFDQCVSARDKGTADAIEDFICPSASVGAQQDIAFQIALDMSFRKIDREVEDALREFQTKKSKDPVIINNQLVDWFDTTGPKAKDAFPAKYLAVCSDLKNPDNPLAKTIKSL